MVTISGLPWCILKEDLKRVSQKNDEFLSKKYVENQYWSVDRINDFASNLEIEPNVVAAWHHHKFERKIWSKISEKRKKFSKEQIAILEKEFSESTILTHKRTSILSEKVGLSVNFIKKFWQEKRKQLGISNPKFRSWDKETHRKLESFFEINANPTREDIIEIQMATQLTRVQVLKWYRERRYKQKQTVRSLGYYDDLDAETLSFLEKEFRENNSPLETRIIYIRDLTGLDNERISNWFQNITAKNLTS